MGVMSCSRKNCGNIMCDTYIDDVGYICWECQKEFKAYMADKNLNEANEHQLKSELKTFIMIEKGVFDDEIINVDDFFKKYTK